MVGFTAVRTDISAQRMAEYTEKVNQLDLTNLVAEFLSYLDYTEESESGHIFNPVQISSCRVLMSQPLDYVITQLRKKVEGYSGIS